VPANVLRLVMAEALAITDLGIRFGVAGCLAFTRYMAGLLFGIRPADPLTVAAVRVMLDVVARQVSNLPAREAMKVDPAAARVGRWNRKM
jgi:hypothetical protein